MADLIRRELEIRVDPSALFDVQIKRIHEYKRQLLNILEAIALYNAIRARPMDDWTPRVKIFAGKAAASYHQAKLIIKLIHDVAKVINSDPTVRNVLKIVFLPNYSVSLAEIIIPAADLSEQISTAGMEASGTGNMKFALNGALTIGTLDGANIEILDRVGDDNMFIFGLTADQVEARRRSGIDCERPDRRVPRPRGSPVERRRRACSPLMSRTGTAGWSIRCATTTTSWSVPTSTTTTPPSGGSPICGAGRTAWWQASILNTANVGWFSSDRSIREYAERDLERSDLRRALRPAAGCVIAMPCQAGAGRPPRLASGQCGPLRG